MNSIKVKPNFPQKPNFENGLHAKSTNSSTQIEVHKRSMKFSHHMDLLYFLSTHPFDCQNWQIQHEVYFQNQVSRRNLASLKFLYVFKTEMPVNKRDFLKIINLFRINYDSHNGKGNSNQPGKIKKNCPFFRQSSGGNGQSKKFRFL